MARAEHLSSTKSDCLQSDLSAACSLGSWSAHNSLGVSGQVTAAGGVCWCPAIAALPLVHSPSVCSLYPIPWGRKQRQDWLSSSLQPWCRNMIVLTSTISAHMCMLCHATAPGCNAGVAVHSREEAALAACSVLHNHSNDQKLSSHMTELTAGIANIMIALEVLPSTACLCNHARIMHMLSYLLTIYHIRGKLIQQADQQSLPLFRIDNLLESRRQTAEGTSKKSKLCLILQCQGSLVLWLLASVLSLWSLRHQSSQAQLSGPEQQQAGQGATSPTSSSMNSDSDLVGQAMSLYSMMRQVGTAMLQRRADCLDAAMQMIELISAASHTGHW